MLDLQALECELLAFDPRKPLASCTCHEEQREYVCELLYDFSL